MPADLPPIIPNGYSFVSSSPQETDPVRRWVYTPFFQSGHNQEKKASSQHTKPTYNLTDNKWLIDAHPPFTSQDGKIKESKIEFITRMMKTIKSEKNNKGPSYSMTCYIHSGHNDWKDDDNRYISLDQDEPIRCWLPPVNMPDDNDNTCSEHSDNYRPTTTFDYLWGNQDFFVPDDLDSNINQLSAFDSGNSLEEDTFFKTEPIPEIYPSPEISTFANIIPDTKVTAALGRLDTDTIAKPPPKNHKNQNTSSDTKKRRNKYNNAEKNRRKTLSEEFKKLEKTVDDTGECKKKRSEINILKDATDLIEKLKEEEEALEYEIKELSSLKENNSYNLKELIKKHTNTNYYTADLGAIALGILTMKTYTHKNKANNEATSQPHKTKHTKTPLLRLDSGYEENDHIEVENRKKHTNDSDEESGYGGNSFSSTDSY